MKRNVLVILLFVVGAFQAFAQETMDQVMDKRAKELVRVLNLADREQWKKFIRENYTQALIDKKMKMKVQSSDGNETSTDESKSVDNLEEKAGLFQRLHDDLGTGKAGTIKRNGEKLDMEVEGDSGAHLKFALTFSKEKPYLIDGFGVQMQMENR